MASDPIRPALSFGISFRAASTGCAANDNAAPVPRAAVPFDPWRFRAAFPDRWQAFLRAHYRSPEHVAVAFGVTERAARGWWEGTGGPQGDKVVVAVMRHGGAFMAAMGVAA